MRMDSRPFPGSCAGSHALSRRVDEEPHLGARAQRARPSGTTPYTRLVAKLRAPIVALVSRFAARLRYPQLVGIMAALFVLDLLIPDAIPFVDEVLLGLGTLLLGSLKRRQAERGDGDARERDV